MKAVHFGAGSIGRGFICDLLFESGYDITLVDINKSIVEQINQSHSYDIYLINQNYKKKQISPVTALLLGKDEPSIIDSIREADVITTSVWADNLPKIAGILAKGILERQKNKKQKINIIVCENAVNNGDILKKSLKEQLSMHDDELNELVAIPNTVVDRLVINSQRDGFDVIDVGDDYELVIEQHKLANAEIPINGAHYTQELDKYLFRKLYIVNGGHAWAGYIGHIYGYKIMQDILNNPVLLVETRAVMLEVANVVRNKFNFSKKELNDYIDFVIRRFLTPGVVDTVDRVCRSPIRKLEQNDRLVAPAIQCQRLNTQHLFLIKGIAAAFLFENSLDEQSVEIQSYIKKHGIQCAITHYTGITSDQPIYNKIVEKYAEYLIIKQQIKEG